MSVPKKFASATDRIARAMSGGTQNWSTATERIESMRRFYLRVDRDDELAAVLQATVRNAVSTDMEGRRLEGRFVAVVGPAGAGKTSILRQAFADLGAFEPYRELAGTMLPLLSVEAHRPASSKALATSILSAMGVPFGRRIPSRVAWEMVRANLALRQVVLLHVDEAHHCLRDGDAEAQLARDELKGLVQGSWPVSIILSGIPSLEAFVKADSQIMRRSTFFALEALDRVDDADLVSAILAELAKRAKLDLSFPPGYDVVDRLACAGCLQVGRVVKVVLHAAEAALEAGDRELTLVHLARSFRDITLCGDERNVFLADGYDRLVHWPDDVVEGPAAAEAPPLPPKRGKKQR